MTTSLVLFLALTFCTVALCLWTAWTALRRSEPAQALHRATTLTTAGLLPAVTLVTTFGLVHDARWAVAVGSLLPVLAITAAWCNFTTLLHQGFLLKVLHLPLFLFNALLAGIYAVRVSQDLFGIDLGTWGSAVTAGHALLQTKIGQADAFEYPFWFYLPFMLPLCSAYRWPQTFALLCSSAVATLMLGLLVAAMPFAYTRAASFREAPGERLESLPLHMAVGIKMPWGEAVWPEEQLRARQDDLLALQTGSVTIDVRPEVFDKPELLTQVHEGIDTARREGLQVTVVARPSRWLLPSDMHRLTLEMSKLHWQIAEKLQPDLLVLYGGPFGRLAELTIKVGTVEEWSEAIARSAAESRQANPDVRVAVALESRAPHAEELFRMLSAEGSPVDAVGFSVFAGRYRSFEMASELDTLKRWMEAEPAKPVHVFETGACPHTTGGELGQWRFLESVLRFAAESGVASVTIDALVDHSAAFGLVGREGHQRMAYRELGPLLLRPVAAPR